MGREVISKIHSKGYWRIVIRPTEYENERFNTLGELKALLEKATLHLSGWHFPHINQRNMVNGQNFVESFEDFSVYKEFWRFYQSGQFLYLFGIEEDWDEERVAFSDSSKTEEHSSRISIDRMLYSVTQSFEFASRLTSENHYDNIHIEISLHNTQGRRLYFWDKRRSLNQVYISAIPTIEWKKSFSKAELLSNTAEISLGVMEVFLERFNCHINTDVFKEEQAKLLSGRLPYGG